MCTRRTLAHETYSSADYAGFRSIQSGYRVSVRAVARPRGLNRLWAHVTNRSRTLPEIARKGFDVSRCESGRDD